MRKIKYSCENNGVENYKIFHPNYSYPVPKLDTYYFHIANFPEKYDKYKVILVIEKVFAIIQRSIDEIEPKGQILHFKSTSDISKAEFIFSFGSGQHKVYNYNDITTCPADFDGESGVLAHAFDLKSGKPYGGQVHLDMSEKWDTMFSSDGQGIHLLTVVLHELLHALGLGHSTVRDSVMYPSYTGEKSHLRYDDKLGLSVVFKPIKQNVYNYLKSVETKKVENKGKNAVYEFIKELIKWLLAWKSKNK